MDELVDEEVKGKLDTSDIKELQDIERNPKAKAEPETQDIKETIGELNDPERVENKQVAEPDLQRDIPELMDEERQEDNEPVMTAAQEIEQRVAMEKKDPWVEKAEINIVEPNLKKDEQGEQEQQPEETDKDKDLQFGIASGKVDRVYDLEYIQNVVKYAESEKCQEEKVRMKFELEPEDYKSLVKTMERDHIYLFTRYMTYIKPELPKGKGLKDKVAYDEDTGRVAVPGTDIQFYVQDLEAAMEKEGVLSFTREDKAERIKEKSGAFQTIDIELLGRGTSAEAVLDQAILTGVDYALKSAGVLKDGDTMYNDRRKADYINYIRIEFPEKYEKFVMRQGYSEIEVMPKGETTRFITKKDFGKPDEQDINMNALLEFLVEKTHRVEKRNIQHRSYFKPRELSLRQLEAFLLSEKSIKELAAIQGIDEEDLRDMLEEHKARMRTEAKTIEEEGAETEKSNALKDTANGIELMQDSELEWKAANVLYEFVKKGGIMEEKLKERNLSGPFTLAQACSIIPAYAGLPCPNGETVSKEVADLMSKGSTIQNKIFTKVIHLNEIQGPNGERKNGNVNISPMMDAKEQEKSQSNAKESIFDALGDPIDMELLTTRGIIA